MSPRSSAGSDTRVLDYLEREADMDGLVTTVQREIVEATGLAAGTVGESLRRLERSGRLRRNARGGGMRSRTASDGFFTSEYQLLGEEWS